ncbi:MAG: D-tyrosyl-tRNA(Tyr) deacylase [Bacteroidales bacterium]|nr:D-tyrosyl-tRNA(Tyr) deacylase [Bacteroidales bacterium]
MRAVIQKVSKASVTVENRIMAEIRHGLLVLLGIEDSDTIEDVNWLCNKIIQLRIFNDKNDVMNLSVQDAGGDILVISQFTLHAKTKKGNRPSYIRAAHPDIAVPLYEQFISTTEKLTGKSVGSGKFGAKMDVSLINDGPVTIIIDTKNKE